MEHKRDDEKSTHEHERRHSDPLLKDLIEKVSENTKKVESFSEEMAPWRELMKEIDAAKRAGIIVLSILAGMGAVLKWFWDFKDHVHKGNG